MHEFLKLAIAAVMISAAIMTSGHSSVNAAERDACAFVNAQSDSSDDSEEEDEEPDCD